MASRSWNRIEIIGNLTRDPELRYTPNGAAVCTFGVATNRSYIVDGERKEDVDFHKIVAWNKLGELCNQLLKKGSRVFMSGRLQYREWETQEGQKRRDAEIVLEDMVLLTPKAGYESGEVSGEMVSSIMSQESPVKAVKAEALTETIEDEPAKEKTEEKKAPDSRPDEVVGDEDLPF